MRGGKPDPPATKKDYRTTLLIDALNQALASRHVQPTLALSSEGEGGP